MKKTYEMVVNPNDYNINNNIQNSEIYHKIIEDPFIPAKVEAYLSVINLYNNKIKINIYAYYSH